jgi:hypothetical protein
MVDVFYCPNAACPFGINLTELFKTAERCPKCGTQTQKLGFADMIKLVEQKKTYQKTTDSQQKTYQTNIELQPEKTETNQQLINDKKEVEPSSPILPTSPSDADTAMRKEIPEDEIQKTIDDLRNLKAGEVSSVALPENAQKSILDEVKMLVEQNKVLIKQNELILGSVNLRKLKLS